MLNEDVKLHIADIQSLKNIDAVASFFASLGYDVQRLQQSPLALGITDEKLTRHIQHIEQIAVQDGELYIYLFVMKSVRISDRLALAKAFRNAEGEYFLAITSDFESIDFVLLERILPSDDEGNPMIQKQVVMQQHVLTVRQADLKDKRSARIPLRVLRRFTNTESDVLYQIEKLLSAYKVAKWSRPMFNNLALFSDYYLENRLEEMPEWIENRLPIYNQLNLLFVKVRERLGTAREEQTRSELLEPIFENLGFTITKPQIDQDNIQPDYYLSIDGAEKPLTYVLTYRWNRYLDGRDMSTNEQNPQGLDTQKREDNPGARVVSLLAQEDSPPYIIVTNGKLWRLYGKNAHSRSTNYYEIDLEETLTDPEREETIRYFWLFFRSLAFVPQLTVTKGISRSQSFLDRVRMGSIEYAKKLESNLKDRVFEDIFPQFAEGFIRDRWGNTTPSQAELDVVYQGTLTFLYRLMFLLYAESRDLLPIYEERGYLEISLKKLKESVANHAKNVVEEVPENLKSTYKATSTELYEHLIKLFEVIDHGNAELNVPHYNGGLFVTNPSDTDNNPDAQNARFLRDTKIPDFYLALGLDRLARDLDTRPGGGLVPIDYKSLGVSQLGSIYEGLLEFKLRVAPEKMAIVKGKKDKVERIIPYGKSTPADIVMEGRGKDRAEKTKPKGAIYLDNTKQERKASGSYYTPDYIVKYIVEHTVEPVLRAKFAELTPRMRAAEKRYFDALQNSRNATKKGLFAQNPELVWDAEDMQQLASDVLEIKILDPAMGSGHFLVEVVDFVTDQVLKFLDRFRHNPVESQLRHVRESILENMNTQGVFIDEKRLTDINLLKRQVLKRVVYGVDLNRMAVELAKVSLWLDAFTLGAPLSFLDHHLRWGNSLVGAFDLSSAVAQGSPRWNEIARGAAGLVRVGQLADVTEGEVLTSKEIYKQARADLEPTIQRLNVQTAKYFTNLGDTGQAEQYPYLSTEGKASQSKVTRQKFDQAQSIAQEKRFFHWKLEFPEVFVDVQNNVWRKNAGFDAIVGNPPYLSAPAMTKDFADVRSFLSTTDNLLHMKWDLYCAFLSKGRQILQDSGSISFIIPNQFFYQDYASLIREKFLLSDYITELIDLGNSKIFEDATVMTCILIAVKNSFHENSEILLRISQARIIDSVSSIESFSALQSLYTKLPNYIYRLRLNNRSYQLVKDIYSISTELGEICYGSVGVVPHSEKLDRPKEDFIFDHKVNDKCKKYIEGKDADRYEINWENRWLEYDYNIVRRPSLPELLESPKIVLKIVAGKTGLNAAYDTEQLYTDHSFVLFTQKSNLTAVKSRNLVFTNAEISFSRQFDLRTLLALINSRIVGWVFEIYLSSDLNIGPDDAKQLPIRTFNFATPTNERKQLAQTIINAYENNSDVLSQSGILISNNQTDVIHDILAHLAQIMLNLSEKKKHEIARFLTWLEGQIGTKIENFSGKTIIQNYLGDYQAGEPEHPFDDILDHLLKTANARQMRINIKDKTLQGTFRQAYEKSLETLRPIKENLAHTNILIDKIVYQLYELTDEEIELVERPFYVQSLIEAKTQVLDDKELQKNGDDEQMVTRFAEGVLQASNLFFARVPSENYEERLNNDLPNWRNLPPEAPVFMKTGDYVLATQPDELDFSTSVVSYTKAVETTLYQRIFIPFRQSHKESDCQNAFMLRFMRGETELTLGNFPIILASSKENALRQFITYTFPNAGQNIYGQTGVVTLLNDKAIVDIRNDSAHDTLQSKETAEDMRDWAIQILSRIQA